MNWHFFHLISLKVIVISAGIGTSGSWMALMWGDWTEDLSVLYEGGKENVALSEYQHSKFLFYELVNCCHIWKPGALEFCWQPLIIFPVAEQKRKTWHSETWYPLVCYRAFGEVSLRRKEKKIIYKSHLEIIVLLAATHGRQKIPLNKPFLTFLIPLDKQNYLQHLNMYFHIHTLTRWTSIKMRWESF